jgi:UDP-N-acetylmuramate--alanine ligase
VIDFAGRPWLHFVGVAGSGMSALAQFHVGRGGRATGSDRAFDQGRDREIRAALEAAGVEIVPQDGTAPARGCAAVVTSTAVEAQIADLVRARELNIPCQHRSELLAVYVARHRTIAVTGTSGKSTTTAMVWTILDGCGREPRLLTGGPLVALQQRGLLGNAYGGATVDGADNDAQSRADAGPAGDLLVIEADESDGSVVRYHPWAGVVLNLARDHKEIAEVAEMFTAFRLNCGGPLIVGDARNLDFLRPGAVSYGLSERADVRATDLALGPRDVAFTACGVRFVVPWPGRHTVLNALAAIAVCREVGVAPAAMAAPLSAFAGVARRFVSQGSAGGVEVIDDFAHNPDKLAAAIATGRDRLADPSCRVLAVFQPHGFGPTRFLRADLVAALAAALRRTDILWLPEIFYAGGTVARDISSGDLAADLVARDRDARFCADRADLPRLIAACARPGDLVLVMGARDPSLTGLARDILAALGSGAAGGS